MAALLVVVATVVQHLPPTADQTSANHAVGALTSCRHRVLVAKLAAVIDRLSGGRLTLGVSLGSRPDDYQIFGATLEHRVTRFRRQIATLRRVWAEVAIASRYG
jgi:alkanesulfonate monooxygenase SsuD/methylene tetrahydromethanopterin reductase-like flavin-dependent oxidoreductase (luciferase family)